MTGRWLPGVAATPAPGHPRLGPEVLRLDCEAEAQRIAARMVDILATQLRRRGAVVALSGGVDSGVCAALSARAFGAGKVLALLLPDRESAAESTERGRRVAEHLGIRWVLSEISPALEAIGCYAIRDEAVRAVFPAYAEGWKCKLAIAGGRDGGINFFKLVVQEPGGAIREARLPLREYLQIVAATSFKQRIRKCIEYHYADRLNYAVIGTPNRLEYDQGFFVKNGDGAADIKPIAHLYKTQVYALALHFGLPAEVCSAVPTTDTYSMAQGQDEFYFGLPWDRMDMALWAYDRGVAAEELARHLGCEPATAHAIYRDIEAKRRASRYLHSPPCTIPDARA